MPLISRIPRWLLRAAAPLSAASLLLFAAWWFCPRPPLLDTLSFSTQVLDRHNALLRVTLSDDQKLRLFTPLDDISPRIVDAVLLHEDRHFWKHPGVNPVSLARASAAALAGHRAGGASTITMQLARLRFHLRTDHLSGKAEQIVRALQLERHYSKRQILEAYLNLAPYGRNVEGVGAACIAYFGKQPAKVTLAEAAALGVIPQSPARRSPKRGGPNTALAAAQDRLYRRLSPETLGRELDVRSWQKLPFEAPHAVSQAIEQTGSARTIRTTLDLGLQHLLERCAADYTARNNSFGVRNAAALLIDYRTMEVLAQVGSAEFSNSDIAGQVDVTRSFRSPGSTLKPFVYALAMDLGLIHPATMLVDMPRSFGGFNPENSDLDFAGPIPARDALAHSRNIPAVALAAKLRDPSLYTFLYRCGLTLPLGEKHYGLALPLGGAEVRMQDLAMLYAMLANGGLLKPLRHEMSDLSAPGRRALSAEAAFLALDMLGDTPRPGSSGEPIPGIYWKTGTSQGFRDAWTAAVFDRFVLVVWIGNSDGKANPAFVGRTCAAPFLFQIADALRARGVAHLTPLQPPPNANLRKVDLCAISGGLPNPHCPRKQPGWFIPGISPITTCDVHREVILDAESGLRLPADDGSRPVIRTVFEFWPAELEALFDRAGLPRRSPPDFLRDSAPDQTARSGKPPKILSPHAGVRYAVRTGDGPGGSLQLRADADAGVHRLFWFAGRAFVGTSAPGEPLRWNAAPGDHRVIALDDHGRAATATVEVEAAP